MLRHQAVDVLVVLLATALTAAGFSSRDVPTPQFEFEPSTIHVTIPKSDPKMTLAAIHLSLNERIPFTQPGKVNKDLSSDGQVFRTTVHLPWKTGDVIHYWVYVVVDGLGYQRLEQTHTIRARSPERPPAAEPFQVPTPRFSFTPGTITVTVRALPSVSLAAIHLNLNDPLPGTRPGRYNQDMEKRGGVFSTEVFANWKAGDTIHYWLYVIYEGLGRQKLNQQFVIPGDVVPVQPDRPGPAQPSALLPARDQCGSRFLDEFDFGILGGRRVVNAPEVSHGDYPWQAQIQMVHRNGTAVHHCGGIIISDRHILTAAHCLDVPPGSLSVVVGQYNLAKADDEGEDSFRVQAMAVHRDYRSFSSGYANDIAVLLLDTRSRVIQYGDYVKPICLPTGREELGDRTECLVSGWGRTSAELTPLVLHGGPLRPVSSAYCATEEVYGSRFNASVHLCAGHISGGLDSCGGDSGGPLACRDTRGRFFAAGIVSWGSLNCGEPRYVGVYTRVSSYLSWISDVIDHVLPVIS